MSVRPEERDKPYEIAAETNEKEMDATETVATDATKSDATGATEPDATETDTTDAMETDAMEATETDVRTTLPATSNESRAPPPSARR